MIRKLKSAFEFVIKIDSSTFEKKILLFLICTILAYAFTFITSIFLFIIDLQIKKTYGLSIHKIIIERQFNFLSNKNLYKPFLYLCLIAPIFEELIHRLPLKLKKWNIAVSLCSIFLLYIKGIFNYNFHELFTWFNSIIIILILIFIFFVNFNEINLSMKSNLIYIIVMSLIFGLLHMNNFYRELPPTLLWISVLFVLPQVIFGLISSYLRLKNGVEYSILLHIIFNTSVFLVNYILK